MRAVMACALLAAGLAACSGGDSTDDGGTQAPVEQPGVFRSITDWAGSPDAGGLGDRDGTGSAARFMGPGRVAVANDGSVYVAELGPHLRRIDAAGQVTTVLDWSSSPLDVVVNGRHILLGTPGPMVAAPSGGVFMALERADGMLGGLPNPGGSWAVLHLAAGLAPQVVALPASESETLIATGLAVDRQGRLYVATHCAIWRSAAEAPGSNAPRPVQKLYEAAPAAPGQDCMPYMNTGISRLVLDANDRVLFTLRQGDVKRLEADGSVTTLGRTSAGPDGSMTIDPRGGLLLTDGNSALLRLDDAGRESTVAGLRDHPGAVDGSVQVARFGAVSGVAVDGQGRIVLTDSGNHTIRRIEGDGKVVTIAGRVLQDGYADGVAGDAYFSRQFTIGAGGGDHVLVADTENKALREVDGERRVRTFVGGPRYDSVPPPPPPDGPIGSTYLTFPTHSVRTADGSIWMIDGNSVRRWGPDGIIRTVSTAGLDDPRALAIDRNGDVIVARSRSSEFWPPSLVDGHYFERHSTRNPQAAPERLPIVLPGALRRSGGPLAGVCALPDGSLVFTQTHAVMRRAADGTATLLAGSGGGSQDGPALAAGFNFPQGLACDAHGGVYVADFGNHTVRYIDAQRNVRTVLGTAGVAGHRVDALPGELDSPRSLVLVPGGLVVATGQGMVRAGF
jgi:DNA-binding beta-propeller fold protein YncE